MACSVSGGVPSRQAARTLLAKVFLNFSTFGATTNAQ
jgi:hypothetical protein